MSQSASVLPGFSKHEKTDEGRGLLLFSSVWKTKVKHEARVFEMASQSAPNCKQKKAIITCLCDFCVLLFFCCLFSFICN